MRHAAIGPRIFRPSGANPTLLARSAPGSRVFLWRFFAISQFKRSAMPNGPKVLAGGSLSPRGDWRAPSDGNARAWLDDLEQNVPEG